MFKTINAFFNGAGWPLSLLVGMMGGLFAMLFFAIQISLDESAPFWVDMAVCLFLAFYLHISFFLWLTWEHIRVEREKVTEDVGRLQKMIDIMVSKM